MRILIFDFGLRGNPMLGGAALFLAALALILPACTGPQQVKEVTETRTVTPPAKPSEPTPSSTDRFEKSEAPPLDSRLRGNDGKGMMDSRLRGNDDKGMMNPHTAMTPPFTWTVPPGWEALAPTAMRLANFKVASNAEVECYVTVLQGTGGGLAANVNRWCGQMGQPEMTPEALAALSKIEVLGQQSPVAEIAGNYTAMTSGTKPGYLLLGLVAELPDLSVFVKMTGPEAAVRAEHENFLAFCQSLREGQ